MGLGSSLRRMKPREASLTEVQNAPQPSWGPQPSDRSELKEAARTFTRWSSKCSAVQLRWSAENSLPQLHVSV